jgi:hypothetical protein
MKYVWIKGNKNKGPIQILHSEQEAAKAYISGKFDEDNDEIYQLGNKVSFNLSLNPTPSKREGIRGNSVNTVV